MAVEMELRFDLPRNEDVAEADVLVRRAESPDSFEDYADQEGRLVLRHDGRTLEFGDVLAACLPRLVFEVLPKLETEGRARLAPLVSDLDMALVREGEAVIASTEIDAPFSMPAAPFAAAARAALARFADLAAEIWPDSPGPARLRAALRAAEAP